MVCAREADNVNDHLAGTEILQAEKDTRKSGFACIVLILIMASLGKFSLSSTDKL